MATPETREVQVALEEGPASPLEASPMVVSSSDVVEGSHQTAPAQRHNRIVMLCAASSGDAFNWPLWKYAQMKRIRGVTDFIMLAFRHGQSALEARIDGTKHSVRTIDGCTKFDPVMVKQFLNTWHDPGRTWFVYGGHGMGDYVEPEQHDVTLQCHELAALMGGNWYEAVVFDACFMSSLDCAYYLRKNTRYIGASEGYMWEDDTELDRHIFNNYTASAISRFKDPLTILNLIKRDYTTKSKRADFSILETTHVEELYRYCQSHVLPRIYERASFFNKEQRGELKTLAEDAVASAEREDEHDSAIAAQVPANSHLHVATYFKQNRRLVREEKLRTAIQYEHSLYPSEVEDKHICDLKQYLIDIAIEEELTRRFGTLPQNQKEVERFKEQLFSTNEAHEPVESVEGEESDSDDQRGGAPDPDFRGLRTTTVGGKKYVVLAENYAYDPATHQLVLLHLPNDAVSAAPAVDILFDQVTSRTDDPQHQGKFPDSMKDGELSSASSTSSMEDTPRQNFVASLPVPTGIALFEQVVLSHQRPVMEQLYATRLGGLSIVAPELSRLSRPVRRSYFHNKYSHKALLTK